VSEERPPNLWWGMFKRFAIAAMLIVGLAAGVTATAALEQVKQVADALGRGSPLIRSVDLTPDKPGAPQTILVIGSDKRALARSAFDRKDPPHSDTLLLMRMDPNRSQTSVLSIPRDLQVTYSDHGRRYPGAKINSAYTVGGAKLAVSVLKQTLPGISIQHVVDVNFNGFRRAVDAVGCVYTDVDRRYFNDNLSTPTPYATINIQPGYQRLCGQDALDYVRYRHTDSDFVRVARQQDFIRQMKEQVGVNGVIDKRTQIENAVGPSITTDVHGVGEVIRLSKLIAFSVGRPVRQVRFQSRVLNLKGGSYVTATAQQIHSTVSDFLNGDQAPRLPSAPAGRRPSRGSRHHRGTTPTPVPGLTTTPDSSRQAALAHTSGSVSLFYPRSMLASGGQEDVRAYRLRDESRNLHRAYRVVFSTGLVGDYYGVQGMDWTTPPMLAHASPLRAPDGHRFLAVNDGQHIHVLAWRTAHAVYWLSNSLLERLSNAQMLAIAESAAPLH